MPKNILQKTLAYLAKGIIKKYKPTIIGITGSVGKTSTRQAIFTVLKSKYRVRTAEKNYNNEIGLPLTILGIPHYGHNILKWVFALASVWFRLVLLKSRYPEILILEYGVDRPGDMEYLLQIARPYIGVVTAMGEMPVHVEFFKDPEDLAKEKAKLVQALPASGHAILNHDDYAVYDMKDKTKANVLTFGFEENSSLKITNYELRFTKDEKLGNIPAGISFKIERGGHLVPFILPEVFGEPQAYAVAAASAVGVVLGLNLVEISDAMRDYIPPPGRLRLIKGNKDTFILDDTYNAAPEAMRRALETLKSLPGKRKIAVLGDMLEIGKYTEQVHRAIGDQAAEFVDLLITVGPRAKFIADEAMTRGAEKSARTLLSEQILKFEDVDEAGKKLDSLLKPGDLILVKGSQSMRMEKAVLEIMASPTEADKLLVRQEEYWKN